MGLLEQEIKELRLLNKQLMAGTITPETAQARIAIYSQTEKRAKMMLQAFTLNAKYGKKIIGLVMATNLIGNGSRIDLGLDAEVDNISCPEKTEVITRAACLEYSGDKDNATDCSSCPQFKVTRDLLLPSK